MTMKLNERGDGTGAARLPALPASTVLPLALVFATAGAGAKDFNPAAVRGLPAGAVHVRPAPPKADPLDKSFEEQDKT